MDHNVDISYEMRASYLLVVLQGTYVQAKAEGSVEGFVKKLQQSGARKVLVDYTKCNFVTDLEVIRHRSEDLENLDCDKSTRVALVFASISVESEYYEAMLRQAGIQVRTFDQFESAEAWLGQD